MWLKTALSTQISSALNIQSLSQIAPMTLGVKTEMAKKLLVEKFVQQNKTHQKTCFRVKQTLTLNFLLLARSYLH